MSRHRNRVIVGIPFTLEVDVVEHNHDTGEDEAVNLTTATSCFVRLIPDGGSGTDYAISAPTTPVNRFTYAASGAEITQAGEWQAVIKYTLNGARETFPTTFNADEAAS